MAWSFNPFTGNLDIVGGGAVVFEGEVETFAELPETVGDPAVGASFLVRSSTGVWLVNRRQAGIWIRKNNTGVRATDWEYGGDYPVNSVNGQTGNVSLTATNVGAGWALVVSSQFITGNTLLSAGRNRRITLSVVAAANVDLPYENNADGDVVTLVQGATGALTATIRRAANMSGGTPSNYETLVTLTTVGQSFTFVSNGTPTGWSLRSVDAHAASHAAAGSDPVTLNGTQVVCDGGSGVWGNGENLNDVFANMGNAAYRNDDFFALASHAHGNITDGGLVGTTSGLPLKTGTGGIVEAGAFGTSAGEFVQGNDSRIADIRATSINTSDGATSGGSIDTSGSAGAGEGIGGSINTSGGSNGHGGSINTSDGGGSIDTTGTGSIQFGVETIRTTLIGTATVDRSISLPNASGTLALTSTTIASTLVDAKGDLIVGTAADTVARLPVGATNGHVLTVDSAEAGGMKWAAASGGVTGAAASASDVLGVSGANITGVDAGSADRLVMWDDSASKLTYLEAGSGLSISGTTMTATASGGSKTYAFFAATGSNQPPATNFAVLDTRNSIACLTFRDTTADDSAIFVGVMPGGAALSSGLKVRIHWMSATQTSGNVRWQAHFQRCDTGTDLDSDSFDANASNEATGTASSTLGAPTITEITCGSGAIDGIVAGDAYRLRITREQSDTTNDTMTERAQVFAVEVRSAA